MSTIKRGNHIVEMRSEPIEVTSLDNIEPDDKWRYTDPAGHVHVWVQTKDGWSVPTAHYVEDSPGSIDEDGEEYGPTGHEACVLCGATVMPGYIDHGPDVYRKYIAGPVEYLIDGEPVTEVEAKYTAKTGQLLPRVPDAR